MTKRPGHLIAWVGLFGLALGLTGCMGGGLDLAGQGGVDKNLTTRSVPGQPKAQAENSSDEATVRNAVSSADLGRLGSQSTIPWANTSTGSAGVVSKIQEENAGSLVCRSFVTTRHSYRGIASFAGKTCQAGTGNWQLTAFSEQD